MTKLNSNFKLVFKENTIINFQTKLNYIVDKFNLFSAN